jgi:hypothetical protein
LQAEEDNGANDGGVPGQQRMSHDISIGEPNIGKQGIGAGYRCAGARMTLLPYPRKNVSP